MISHLKKRVVVHLARLPVVHLNTWGFNESMASQRIISDDRIHESFALFEVSEVKFFLDPNANLHSAYRALVKELVERLIVADFTRAKKVQQSNSYTIGCPYLFSLLSRSIDLHLRTF